MVSHIGDLTITAGESFTISSWDIWTTFPEYAGPEVGEWYDFPYNYAGFPPGSTSANGENDPGGKGWEHILTCPDVPEGDYTITMGEFDRYGDFEPAIEFGLAATVPEEKIEPPAPVFGDIAYTLPDDERWTWLVNDEPAAAGTYPVTVGEDPVTITVQPIAADGYVFDPPAEPITHTWEPADDSGGWDWPDEPTTGGKLIARWLKWDSVEQQRECSLYYEVVRSFVWGYTRGHGFDEDGLVPAKPLERVIVAAGARLAYNPEYVTRWQVSQESETMSVFQGFNLAEQAILNRYRRTWA